MRKFLTILAALVVPLFAIRTIDLWFFIDRKTGYVTEWTLFIRILIGLAVVAIGVFAGIGRRRSLRPVEEDLESGNSSIERSSVPAGVCFFIAGIMAATASVSTLFRLFSSGEIDYLFQPANVLIGAGISKIYYIFAILSALLGLVAAFWLMLVGAWHFRGTGHFAGGRFLSIFVALWFYVRVIRDFVRHPINPNNTTSLVMIFSVLMLALFYTKYCKVVSVDFPLGEEPALFSFGVMAFLWVVGFGLPTVIVYFESGDWNGLIALIADVFAAVAALSALYAQLPAKKEQLEEKKAA